MSILFFVFPMSLTAAATQEHLTISTPDGIVKGQIIISNVSEYYSFTKIPFAEPPIGELRFMPPRPPRPWRGILMATQVPPACPQPAFKYSPVMDEDCLYLNVYTPATTQNRPEKGWPVILWVHGGAFQCGWSYTYGPEHLIKHDVAVITITHRLGALGFLNADVPSASGNAGLHDIVAALRWVQRSVTAFGIDPKRLTLAGQSAGAVAVSALKLSPSSQGLFQRVIMESGSILGYRFFDTEYHKSNAFRLGKLLGIITENPEELVKGLKKIHAMDIIKASEVKQEDFTKISDYTSFVPTLDKFHGNDYAPFFPEHPLKLTKAGNYNKVPQLVGFNSNECMTIMNTLKNNKDLINKINVIDNVLVPPDLYPHNITDEVKNQANNKIREYYFGNKSTSEDTIDSYITLCTELWYVHPIDYSLRLQQKAGNDQPVYYYEFSVDGDLNYGKIKFGIRGMGGTYHSDELGYIWANLLTDKMEMMADVKSKNAREIMVKLWTNFIKTGNPTPEVTEMIPLLWIPVEYPVMNYMQIDLNYLKMHLKSPRVNATNFWNDIYGYDLI